MGWKKLILGDKMPSEDDPKYKKRKEKDIEAGKKFARFLKLDKVAAYLQTFALKHPKTFLVIVFGIVLFCLVLNVSRAIKVYRTSKELKENSVTLRQEEELKSSVNFKTLKNLDYDRNR